MLHFFDNFSQERMIPEESVGLYSKRNPVPVAQLNLRTVQTDTCAQRKGSPKAHFPMAMEANAHGNPKAAKRWRSHWSSYTIETRTAALGA